MRLTTTPYWQGCALDSVRTPDGLRAAAAALRVRLEQVGLRIKYVLHDEIVCEPVKP